jgi:hypothetical protein
VAAQDAVIGGRLGVPVLHGLGVPAALQVGLDLPPQLGGGGIGFLGEKMEKRTEEG